MEINLEGKTAFVTDENSSIGRSILIGLTECGAKVALTYYSGARIQTLQEIETAVFGKRGTTSERKG